MSPRAWLPKRQRPVDGIVHATELVGGTDRRDPCLQRGADLLSLRAGPPAGFYRGDHALLHGVGGVPHRQRSGVPPRAHGAALFEHRSFARLRLVKAIKMISIASFAGVLTERVSLGMRNATELSPSAQIPMIYPYIAFPIGGPLIVVYALLLLFVPSTSRRRTPRSICRHDRDSRGVRRVPRPGLADRLRHRHRRHGRHLNLDLRPMLIPQRMFNGVDSFILLAAPFYILAGELMGRSGITERLVKLSMLITGHFRGGTAFGGVISAVLFSGISGTAVGDTAALGQIFIRQTPKERYSTEYSAAIVVAGSMIGPIVPPSMTLVVYPRYPSFRSSTCSWPASSQAFCSPPRVPE